MVELGSVGDDVNGTLHFSKWQSAVCLFLAVVSRLHLATTYRNMILRIRVDFTCPRARARVPNCWVTTAQSKCLVGVSVAGTSSRAVPILFIELNIALSIDLLGVLGLATEIGGHGL